jgi:hypothetical protein
MKKPYKNINEEVDRIKKLFTEERLYGNLIIENVEECGIEGTRLNIVKKIINDYYKITNDEFDKDNTGCYIYFKIIVGDIKHKFFFWESRWFKYIKERVDGGVFIEEGISKKQRVFSGVYNLIPNMDNIFFEYYIIDQYTDENNKIIKLPETKQKNIPSFDKLYFLINKKNIEKEEKETEERDKKIKTEKDIIFNNDNKRINELLSGYVTEEDLVYVKNIINKYIKNKKDLCSLRFRYILDYKVDFYDEISNVTGLIDLKREIVGIIKDANCEQYGKKI